MGQSTTGIRHTVAVRRSLAPPSFAGAWALRICAVAIVLVVAGAGSALTVSAQEGGPTCPPGFAWERMSGVGCVQVECLAVSNAKYNSEQRCICLDGYRACTEDVDYSGFDTELCAVFCPGRRLVACVGPDAPCPGEAPAAAHEHPEPGPAPSAPTGGNAPGETPSGAAPSVDELVRDLERFVAGQQTDGPSAGEAAAGGIAITTILTTWVLNQLLSGVAPKDVINAVSRWRSGRGTPAPGPEQATATATARIDAEGPPPRRQAPARVQAPPPIANVDSGQAPPSAVPPQHTPPPPELLEDGLRRKVDQTGDYVGAVEKTREQFQDMLKMLPPEVTGHDLWKQQVQPQIDRILKSSDPQQVRTALDHLTRILDAQTRRDWDHDLRHAPPDKREGGVWLERGLRELGSITGDLYKRMVTDPAKSALGSLPSEQRAQAERAIDEQQKKIEEVLEGIARAPRNLARNVQGGAEMNRQLDQIRESDPGAYRDLQEMRHIALREQDRPDFGRGWRKTEPIRQWIGDKYEGLRQWLDRNGPIYFRRTR